MKIVHFDLDKFMEDIKNNSYALTCAGSMKELEDMLVKIVTDCIGRDEL